MRALFALAAACALSLLAPVAAYASGPPTIWFEHDSARLTGRDEIILDDAVRWLRHTQRELAITSPSWIRLHCSADRSGPAAYNLRLSRRRCEAVKAALVRRGFRPEEIRMEAFGESRGIIETADGIPERQNRFVMIMIEPVEAARAAGR